MKAWPGWPLSATVPALRHNVKQPGWIDTQDFWCMFLSWVKTRQILRQPWSEKILELADSPYPSAILR